MRVAVLADIHGNLPALEAVLAELDRLAVDRVVLNGDIAGGPLPGETLARLTELGERAVWVHGNGERGLVAGFDRALGSGSGAEAAHEDDLAVGRLLTRAERDLLADLPTGRARAHPHALRPAVRPAPGGQPGQRGDALRARGRGLGAARPRGRAAAHGVRRRGRRRAAWP